MSCCGRQASERAQVPQRRAARERAPAGAAVPTGGVPLHLVFKGARPLALPVGARRILVLPGQAVPGLTADERLALWRTGLFD
jgi:hypothetical protein